MKFVNKLQERIAAITEADMAKAHAELESGADEIGVGILPEILIKFWAALYLLNVELQALGQEALRLLQQEGVTDDVERMNEEAQALMIQLSQYQALFWAEVREEFGLWNVKSLTVRARWKVVILPPTREGDGGPRPGLNVIIRDVQPPNEPPTN